MFMAATHALLILRFSDGHIVELFTEESEEYSLEALKGSFERYIIFGMLSTVYNMVSE
jgi:hypothetical protein